MGSKQFGRCLSYAPGDRKLPHLFIKYYYFVSNRRAFWRTFSASRATKQNNRKRTARSERGEFSLQLVARGPSSRGSPLNTPRHCLHALSYSFIMHNVSVCANIRYTNFPWRLKRLPRVKRGRGRERTVKRTVQRVRGRVEGKNRMEWK